MDTTTGGNMTNVSSNDANPVPRRAPLQKVWDQAVPYLWQNPF